MYLQIQCTEGSLHELHFHAIVVLVGIEKATTNLDPLRRDKG
jgi:hypothetical protein